LTPGQAYLLSKLTATTFDVLKADASYSWVRNNEIENTEQTALTAGKKKRRHHLRKK